MEDTDLSKIEAQARKELIELCGFVVEDFSQKRRAKKR
jgi:hypothetical protein